MKVEIYPLEQENIDHIKNLECETCEQIEKIWEDLANNPYLLFLANEELKKHEQ